MTMVFTIASIYVFLMLGLLLIATVSDLVPDYLAPGIVLQVFIAAGVMIAVELLS